jgi:cytoskeletal protein CcmA (bactofilin family)
VSLFGKKDAPGAPRPIADTPETTSAGSAPAAAPTPRPERAQRAGDQMANIGKSITIKGDLSGNEDLQIDGSVEGRIDLPNNQLTIGSEGRVKAEVHAKSVVVIGHVTGNLSAADRIQVEATGIVDGDVKAPRLVIEEGAMLNGAVEMTSGAKATTASVQPLAKAAGSF